MEIDYAGYGTTGLPKFGSQAFDSARTGALTEVEGALNQLVNTVKKFTPKGNEHALYMACFSIQQTWGPIQASVAGKATVNG